MRWISVPLALGLLSTSFAQSFDRLRDQIYLKSDGAAFTMDVFKPKTGNGAAVIVLISGGWVSRHENFNLELAEDLTAKGYTCIEVIHGAQPRYKVSEIANQIQRAVRFTKANAPIWGFDATRLGITGGSAGGHLSLLVANHPDAGKPDSQDPVDRFSSSVRAAAVFFPPTDFQHWFADGTPAFKNPLMVASFGKAFVSDPAKTSDEDFSKVAVDLSPVTYLSKQTPPTMIVHGEKDPLVPLSQSYNYKAHLEALSIPTRLVVVPGKGHGWPDMRVQFAEMIEWFNTYLLK